MSRKISLIILVAALLSLLLLLNSCDIINGLIGTEQPAEPEQPEQKPDPENPDVEKPGDEDEEPAVDLSGISLPAYNGVYDGKAHSLAIKGTLPEGVTVAYVGNSAKDAGEYTVSAKFYKDGGYLVGMDITSTITITRAVYDMSGVIFDGATLIAGGEAYNLYVSGKLPSGVSVLRYDGNGKTEVGEHTVTAVFQGDEKNYEPIENMTATLKVVDGPAAFGGICLPSMTRVFDGKTYKVETGGNPTNSYIVEYTSGNTARNAGEYEILARIFDGTNETVISSMLTIKPATLDVKAEDMTVSYDGKTHSISLVWASGEAPVGIIVTESGNATAAAGTHNVRFRFSTSADEMGNYVYHPDINVTLKIELGDAAVGTEGLIYESVTGGFAVVGYEGTDTHIVVPSSFTNSLGYNAKVVEIGSGAFMNNTAITSVSLPDEVKSIGNNAFRGCSSLRSVSMGNYVKVIGALAFCDTAVFDVTLPDSLEAIGQGAFRGAPVERIKIPFIGGSHTTSNPYLGYIFGASAYAANTLYVPTELKTVILSDKCTAIPAYAFFGATSVEEIILSSKTTEIGISAFQGCTSLYGMYISHTVTEIPAAAHLYNAPFYECSDDFVLGTSVIDKASKPKGWGNKWDILNDQARVTVMYSVDYDEFVDAVRAEKYFGGVTEA